MSAAPAITPGKRPRIVGPCVWCHYGPPDQDAPWYALNESRLAVDSIDARDPRWWRSQLGRVSLTLDLYPAGLDQVNALSWPERLGFWPASQDLERLALVPDVITVITPSGERMRAVRVPGGTVGDPVYAATSIPVIGGGR